MKIVKLLVMISLFVSVLASCKTAKEMPCDNAKAAELINMHGLDGCGWAIQLEDGTKLEPFNLKQFTDIELKDHKKIWVSYEDTEGYVSICMIGPIIKIVCLAER